jgi:hypothetical protein
LAQNAKRTVKILRTKVNSMAKPAKSIDGKERRKCTRKPCSTAIAYGTKGFSSIEYIKDISGWGLFIRTQKTMAVGEDITMTIPTPGSDSTIKIIGEVVRQNAKGVGVKFKLGIDDSVVKTIIENS